MAYGAYDTGQTDDSYGTTGAGYGPTRYTGMAEGDEDPLMEQCHLLEQCMGTSAQPAGTCFLSPAESALRNASGVTAPIECWGCTGHATYHANRFHSFRDCPNKYEPEVRTTAFRRMKQLREEWEGRKRGAQGNGTFNKREAATLLTKAEATTEWRELGFTSKKDAERAADAAALMATNISARNRQHLNKEWTHKWGQETDKADEPPGEAGYYGRAMNEGGQQQTYHFIARVFQAVPTRTIPLEISPTLPHCHIPIGPTFGKGKLKVAVDSCAGVNIGHLDFHKAMATTFPELVSSFKTMQEYGEREVSIGGVEVSSAALRITHIIEYKTPFRYNGTACNLTFGLSEQAAATAIVSINFLRKTKALCTYDDAEPSIHLTIWNTTLGIQYEPPTRREPPTPMDRFRAETTAVYTTANAKVVDKAVSITE
jgi:hypothetical protein